jgi:hypothetical protein
MQNAPVRPSVIKWRIEMANDFCDRDGAKRIKDRIEEYWRERGFDVEINLIEAGFMPAMRSARTDVRSDMVNGMPRRRAAEQSLAA